MQINPTPTNEHFYYFYDRKNHRLIKQFVLKGGTQLDHICQVSLIKKNDKFTPRLVLSVRDKKKEIVAEAQTETTNIKARVDLKECHENFWKLVSFLQSSREVEIPQESFSLVSQGDAEIAAALQGRDAVSIVSIIKQLSGTEGVKLSQEDINQLLKRRDILQEFKTGLDTKDPDENKWQRFFEKNKWIFGYGLDLPDTPAGTGAAALRRYAC